MFHLLAFSKATGGAATNSDGVAFTDSEFATRNSHYVITERYKLIAGFAGGATLLNANLYCPSLNAVTLMTIWPLSLSLDMLSPPRVDFRFNFPVPIPQNEELQMRFSDSASETCEGLIWIAPDGWNQNIPHGIDPVPMFQCKFSVTGAVTTNIWSALMQMTFEQSLRGGTYAIVGADLVGDHFIAFRLVFPRSKLYNGRRLRPGSVCTDALGNIPMEVGEKGPLVFGEWGRFSTYELPQVEIYSNATAGSATYEGRLWLVRLSENPDVMY